MEALKQFVPKLDFQASYLTAHSALGQIELQCRARNISVPRNTLTQTQPSSGRLMAALQCYPLLISPNLKISRCFDPQKAVSVSSLFCEPINKLDQLFEAMMRAPFDWKDPFRLFDQLTDEERMIQQSTSDY